MQLQDWSLVVSVEMELSIIIPPGQSGDQNAVDINEVYDISLYRFQKIYKCYASRLQGPIQQSYHFKETKLASTYTQLAFTK